MANSLEFFVSTATSGTIDPTETKPQTVTLLLRPTLWDDFGYKSSFELYWRSPAGPERIGVTKIGRLDTFASFGGTGIRTALPDSFDRVPDDHVSLGQDPEYYELLVGTFGRQLATEILEALGDITLRPDFRALADQQRVVWKSLLRSVNTTTVEDQYRRIVSGEDQRDAFCLTYVSDPSQPSPLTSTEFRVEPDHAISGTLQVVIGPNGAGKTRMLDNIRRSLSVSPSDHVHLSDGKRISGLVNVGFSAFDVPEEERVGLSAREPQEFRPLRITSLDLSLVPNANSAEEVRAEQTTAFHDLVVACATAGREERLIQAFRTLSQGDQELNRLSLASVEAATSVDYGRMSSGHKIVLLTMAGLVAHCDDNTLILVDEPESHLHPPLLSSFVTAIRDLIALTNSLAIVVTHSPVVLQQVPARHARRIVRRGDSSDFTPIGIESWGENLGRLTRAVFKVELDKSGHYAVLSKAAEGRTFGEALEHIGGDIGDEASLILRSLTDKGNQK